MSDVSKSFPSTVVTKRGIRDPCAVPEPLGIRIAISVLSDGRVRTVNFSFKEIAFLAGGCFILLDRGASWMFILGISLLSIGATRIARNI